MICFCIQCKCQTVRDKSLIIISNNFRVSCNYIFYICLQVTINKWLLNVVVTIATTCYGYPLSASPNSHNDGVKLHVQNKPRGVVKSTSILARKYHSFFFTRVGKKKRKKMKLQIDPNRSRRINISA